MRQKTKLKIINYIAQHLTLQGKQNQYQKIAVWTAYLLEPLIFHIVLLASIAQSQFQFPYSYGFQMGLVMTRIAVSVLSLYTKWPYFTVLIKILQIINVYMLRTSFSALGLIPQFIAQMMVMIRKQKRYVNFDSRLQSKFYGTKICAIYILLLSIFFTSQEEMSKTPSSVLFTSLIFYIAACLDQIYSYRTKEILRSLALCPILMAIYFLCEPLVPALNTFGLVAHTIVSLAILFVIIVHAITTEYIYHNPILFKKIITLQSRDKLAYIWALIFFVQAYTYNQLVCFIKTHQSKCFNPLCPLNSNMAHSSHLTQQIILKSMRIYLKKCLQRFSSQNDEIRRLFIYYRQQDDPKITYLLKQNDVFEKIEDLRIVKNLINYSDPSLEYEQMKQIEEETFMKVKLYLNHYEYFLSYLNKDVLKLETSEEIINQLLKLKGYFLSFKPNAKNQNQQQQKQAAPKVIKNSQGYEQIETETIPFKKMTVKTLLLVNFMRRVHFNLPTLQKEEFTSKKLTYINEDIQQTSILIISAESYNLGKVMNWNSMAQKLLLYPAKQLKQKYINDLIPQPLHKHHEELLMKGALRIELNQPSKQLSTLIFCFTKPSYVEVFETKIVGTNSISGNKWIVEMHQNFDKQSIIIVDECKNIIGVNKNAFVFGFGLTNVGQQLDEQIFEKVVKEKKEKVVLAVGVEPIQNMKMQKETQWQLVQITAALQGMQKFFIIQIRNTHEIQKSVLSRYSRHQSTIILPQNFVPRCDNKFQFNFDPFQLKYTNSELPSHSSTDLQLVWQQALQDQQHSYMSYQQNLNSNQRKLINYGDNIHQMIYFDKKLQFKENFQQCTEFQTHPSYLPGGKMVVNNRGLLKININKQNFVQNVNKIKQKTPSFIFKLAIIFIILSIICVICLSLRLVYLNNLYTSSRQKQLINMHMVDRKNLISNIGSLAVYMSTNTTYPNIWDNYLTNGWTFQQLFVGIQYKNGEINQLNGDIGSLVSKGYWVNGQLQTLASYYESLSIQASGSSTGQLNLTKFISQIVTQVSVIQCDIQADIQTYYANQYTSYQQIIMIFDIAMVASCLIVLLLMHIILNKVYMERVHLFKSLTVIEEEQIARILACLNQHREYIKNNELDTIPMEENYQDSIESQNIKHQKRLQFTYFNSKIAFFYLFIVINIIAASLIFAISNYSVNLTHHIELLTPFVNITGEQRDSMTQLYLKTITNIENDTASALMKNIRLFQQNKKGVIDSLIQNQLSDDFMKFYNDIWFSPCSILQVQDQCNLLFSGILSDNLDYNYVYVLTEIQKITDYRTQISTSNDSQFINDANLQISKSFNKINFLLFDFMVKLQANFNPNLSSQVDYLYNSVEKDNLSIFFIALIWVIGLTCLLGYSLYRIKGLPYQTLQMLSTVIPACILMRNEYFVEWYQKKFRNIY